MERIRLAWDAFQVFLDTDTPPPLTDADTVQRSDTFWKDAAAAFATAKAAADAADLVLTAARDALVKLAVHPRESGAGVTWPASTTLAARRQLFWPVEVGGFFSGQRGFSVLS